MCLALMEHEDSYLLLGLVPSHVNYNILTTKERAYEMEAVLGTHQRKRIAYRVLMGKPEETTGNIYIYIYVHG
jgi:hypothetical protein